MPGEVINFQEVIELGTEVVVRAMPGILPRMIIDEALDIIRIYSVADQLPPDAPLSKKKRDTPAG